MKKVLTKALLIAMTIVTLATVIPLSANASTSNEKQVYVFLTTKMGLNSAAACGIMANIERESEFNPKLVIGDSNGMTSGGLCQWNGNRFNSLKNFCNKYGYDYLSIEGQLNYLKFELSLDGYSYIYDYMKGVANTVSGAYDAAYYWCYYFEIPSDRATKANQRGIYAQEDYWPIYGNKTPKKPALSLVNGKVFDTDEAIALKWSTGGSSCNLYRVYAVKKDLETNTYDWPGVKGFSVSASKTTYSIAKGTLAPGYYAIKVRAINNATSEYKDSGYVFVKINCDTHSYSSVITEQPTLTATGTKLYTCKNCGYETTRSVPVVEPQDFNTLRMTDAAVGATSEDAVKLTWDFYEGATGYCVYQRVDGRWVLLGHTKNNVYYINGLEKATEYKFCVRAYVNFESKNYYSTVSKSLVTSTETDIPEIVEAANSGKGKAKITWSKEEGADGYQLYVSTGEDNTSYKRIATVKAETNTYSVSGLKAGTHYNYRVRTYIRCSNGTYVYSVGSVPETVVAK